MWRRESMFTKKQDTALLAYADMGLAAWTWIESCFNEAFNTSYSRKQLQSRQEYLLSKAKKAA